MTAQRKKGLNLINRVREKRLINWDMKDLARRRARRTSPPEKTMRVKAQRHGSIWRV